jgi:hypothetical protein
MDVTFHRACDVCQIGRELWKIKLSADAADTDLGQASTQSGQGTFKTDALKLEKNKDSCRVV